jgi:uncharacterized small protein (DUF1192 family)
MRFNLNAKWAIETEINQVVLVQKGISEGEKTKGEIVDLRRWYWNNFEDALNGMIDRDIQCLEKVEEIEERIVALKSEVRLMLEKVAVASSANPTQQIMSKRQVRSDKGKFKEKACLKTHEKRTRR